MIRPTTRKELRRFIGMVNYYRDINDVHLT
jgi:hypothetical protein